ncbi:MULTISPECIES: Fic family protein [Oligella]|uniref:Fic family protein n=1 Tax=Oligella TaxID=90243 RepID=UPI000E005510|nr:MULTISPECIES: Fic family protein [Oligella]SUA60416.1 Uncharacterised protein [Oligella urethralis]
MNDLRHIGKEQALFIAHKLRDELIFNMAKLEGNSLTFAETQTVIQGISVAGRPINDLNQVINIRDGWDELINQIKTDTFKVDKENFVLMNKIVAKLENPSVGDFRIKPVLITGTEYMPPMDMLLSTLFREMLEDFEATSNFQSNHKLNFESTFNLFLDTARNQYFEDGNKRTGQLMMNGVLILSGYAPFTISPSRDTEFRQKLLDFYESGNKNEMIDFIYSSINSPRYLVMQQELEDDLDR